MENERKNSRNKQLLYVLLPVCLAASLFFLFQGAGSQKKAEGEKKAELFEPEAEQEKAITDKISAYEAEHQAKLKKLREQAPEEVKGADFYFEMKEEEDLPETQKNVFEEQILERKDSTSYSEVIKKQLYGIHTQETAQKQQRREALNKQMKQLEKEEKHTRKTAASPYFPNPSQALEGTPKERENGKVDTHSPRVPQAKAPTSKGNMHEQLQEADTLGKKAGTAFYLENGRRHRVPRLLKEQRPTPLIKACIHGNQVIVPGGVVRMRLLEKIHVGEWTIPENTIFYGAARITSDRLSIEVENIRYGNYLTPVSYIIYDMDAIQGLNLPNNLKAEITQQFQKGLAQGIQLPINSIGTFTSEVTSALNATTQVARSILGKTLSQIKVNLKSNYLMFIQEETPEEKETRQKEEETQFKRLQESFIQQKGTSSLLDQLQ